MSSHPLIIPIFLCFFFKVSLRRSKYGHIVNRLCYRSTLLVYLHFYFKLNINVYLKKKLSIKHKLIGTNMQ